MLYTFIIWATDRLISVLQRIPHQAVRPDPDPVQPGADQRQRDLQPLDGPAGDASPLRQGLQPDQRRRISFR